MERNQQEYRKKNHTTLQEARNKLHSLLTHIMMRDVGHIIGKSLNETKERMEILRKARSQLESKRESASAKQLIKIKSIHQL